MTTLILLATASFIASNFIFQFVTKGDMQKAIEHSYFQFLLGGFLALLSYIS